MDYVGWFRMKRKRIVTAEITFHELLDDLGISAKEIVDVKILNKTKRSIDSIDDPAIQITFEEEPDDE